jgi:hypothetical protein
MTPIIGPIVNAMSSNKSELEASGPPIGVAGASGQRRNFISKMFRPKASGSKGKGLNNEMFDVGLCFSSRYLHASLLNTYSQSHHFTWNINSFDKLQQSRNTRNDLLVSLFA